MEFATSLILIGLILSFFIGQLFRITIFNLSIPLIDIFLPLFSIINILNHVNQKKLIVKNIYFLFFLTFSLFTFLVNYLFFGYSILKPLMYLIRLSSILLLFIFPPDFKIHSNIKKFFILSIIANILFGLIQYLFWPDFTLFKSLNWDPHLYRLISTYFDPTFTAIIYLFFLIYLYFQASQFFSKNINKFLIVITYIAMSLTYSRSTFLSLIILSIYISLKQKTIKVFIYTFTLVLLTILFLPRAPGEGTKLERTSSIKAKIENYQEGIKVFIKSPLIGHGYNNLFYVRSINDQKSHSISGFDSSLLTIATTTGLVGLIFFFKGCLLIFNTVDNTKKYFIIALAVHSLFANSIFYPWIPVLLILI